MASRPVPIHNLISELRQIENWLTARLGVATDEKREPETPDPFSPPDDLSDLKLAIDRIRPLLWVYLTRQHEANALNQRSRKTEVRTLMEDAISISDRYVRKN